MTPERAPKRLIHRRDDRPARRTAPPDPENVTAEGLIARARELAVTFRDAAENGERDRAIPRESVEAMLDAGFARVLVPRRFGGYELGLETWFEIAREIARADASHGWCASLLIHNPHYLTYFPLAGQEEMWGGGVDFAVAGALPPTCAIEPTDGGFLLSGHSPFASGVLHSAWSFIGGMVPDEQGTPEWCWFLMPAEDYAVLDTWDTIGMRGTGSNVIETQGVFVPHHRVLRVRDIVSGDPPGPRPSDNPIYRLPIASHGPLGFSIAILGAAQGAVEEFRALIAGRRGPDGSRYADKPRNQRSLGELASDVDAAELLLRRCIAVAERGTPPDLEERARSLRDYSHAAQLCVGAIDRIMALAGTSAFGATSPLGRAWRDIHFMASHQGIGPDNNYSHWGRMALDVERDPGMVIY
ncbi:MAG: acyl-CoA dehydrogenase family protein [Patulibacter sp.]|nr:acyl-CoA dehydrogenase family protein [Patulibacter sp.]